ncbi:MAG: ABC transporter permease [Sphingomonadaceae bacterium]|nr:ABC transporter permease [Sphingomonadaceae bacterium]
MAENPNHIPGDRRLFGDRWFAELRASLETMYRVIHAIIIRESRTRYGNSNIGYAWALIDPLIELSVLVIAFSLLGRTGPVAAPLSVFLITGIVPFFFWRSAVGRGASAVSANLGLLTYPQVMPADIVIGRVVLDAATTFVIFLLFVIGSFFIIDVPAGMFFGDPGGLLLAGLAFFYFTLASAFFSSSLARILPIWQNVWSYMSRPIWLLSGIFFTLESLPPAAREYIYYNPIAHMIEWFRSAAIPTFESQVYDPFYPLAVATVFLLIGLVIDRILIMTGDEEIVS